MMVTAAGRKIVAISSVNRRSRPGKSKRAKPYATSVHEISTPMVEITETMVLNSSRGKSIRSQTSLKLLKVGENFHGRSSARQETLDTNSPRSGRWIDKGACRVPFLTSARLLVPVSFSLPVQVLMGTVYMSTSLPLYS